MISKPKAKTASPIEIFSKENGSISIPDLLLRLDLISVLAYAEKMNVECFIKQVWNKFFQEIDLTPALFEKCTHYFENYRLGLKVMSKGGTIRNAMVVLRTLISVTLLAKLANNEGNIIDLKVLKENIISELKPLMNDPKAAEEKTDELFLQYFPDTQEEISLETLLYIKQCRNCLTGISTELQKMLLSRRKKSISNKPMTYGRIMCLLHLILSDKEALSTEREKAIEKHWPNMFGTTPFSQSALSNMNGLIQENPFLDAMNMLLKYPLNEIKSGRIVRRIIVCLCVHRVLSILPLNAQFDLIVDEAAGLFSRFDSLSVGKEESDIEEYLKIYLTEDNMIDERVSKKFWDCAKEIETMFKQALEIINTANSARKRAWWEEVIDQKTKELDTLQEQIQNTETGAIYSLIETLSSSAYNHLLSRIYRIAYEIDTPSHEETVYLLRNFIQTLRLFDVEATNEQLVGMDISNPCCEKVKILAESLNGMPCGQIAFPGWKVGGDIVIHPIGCDKEGE